MQIFVHAPWPRGSTAIVFATAESEVVVSPEWLGDGRVVWSPVRGPIRAHARTVPSVDDRGSSVEACGVALGGSGFAIETRSAWVSEPFDILASTRVELEPEDPPRDFDLRYAACLPSSRCETISARTSVVRIPAHLKAVTFTRDGLVVAGGEDRDGRDGIPVFAVEDGTGPRVIRLEALTGGVVAVRDTQLGLIAVTTKGALLRLGSDLSVEETTRTSRRVEKASIADDGTVVLVGFSAASIVSKGSTTARSLDVDGPIYSALALSGTEIFAATHRGIERFDGRAWVLELAVDDLTEQAILAGTADDLVVDDNRSVQCWRSSGGWVARPRPLATIQLLMGVLLPDRSMLLAGRVGTILLMSEEESCTILTGINLTFSGVALSMDGSRAAAVTWNNENADPAHLLTFDVPGPGD